MFVSLEEVRSNISYVREAVNGRKEIFELDDLPVDSATYYDFIYTLVKRIEKEEPVYMECGVWTGRSLAVAHAAREKAVLIGIDRREIPRAFEAIPTLKDKAIYIQGDTRIDGIAKELKEKILGDIGVDVLFIDSTHDYETVMKEWKLYFPLLDQQTGVVLFDDIAMEHQVRTDVGSIGMSSYMDYVKGGQDKRALTDSKESVRQAFEDLRTIYKDWTFEVIETDYVNNPAVGIVYRIET